MDDLAPVRVRREEREGGGHVLERHAHVGPHAVGCVGADPAATELEGPADAAVLQRDADGQVALLQAFAEGREAPRLLDYEVELGLVLKRDVTAKTTVTDANLHEFVAGLVIVNDYSARDVQIPQMQFYKGKSYRTFGPVGPFLCLLDAADVPKLKALQLTLTVNGEVRQNDSTANLVFGPAETLTELSGLQDLFAGDLIATGTPAGCALSIPSPARQRIAALLPEAIKWKVFFKVQSRRPQYLKVGDVVEARIASAGGDIDLGAQRNVVVEERP